MAKEVWGPEGNPKKFRKWKSSGPKRTNIKAKVSDHMGKRGVTPSLNYSASQEMSEAEMDRLRHKGGRQ